VNTEEWVSWFRQAAPYINTHRGKTMVLMLGGEALFLENLIHIVHDIALLNSLGVKLVIVFGAKPQIDEILHRHGLEWDRYEGIRVTRQEMMPYILEAYGALRARLEAKLSMGLVNSPMHGSRIRVCSGNFVMARPLGVLDGVDFEYTGRVRKVDFSAIEAQLNMGQVVLLPALGYSVNGEMFNLDCEELGCQTAITMKADKLILFGDKPGVEDPEGRLLRDLTKAEALAFLNQYQHDGDQASAALLKAASEACSAGVPRAHIIQHSDDGALLKELFTRDGAGTMISSDGYEQIRSADANDLNGIMALIQPLEEKGILIRRSREMIETELDYFTVDERDGAIIGCAALYSFPESEAGELSCFAVREDYRRFGRGDAILAVIEKQAKQQNMKKLFVLTTQTEQWFVERGFERVPVETLPGRKLSSYNLQRKSRVLMKPLT
jgi:amino-acid N-acetyltransferase